MVDQVAQTPVVRFDVALSGAHPLALEPEFAEVECHFALLGQPIFGARILRDEDTDDSNSPSRFHCIDQRIHDKIRDLLAGRVMTLIADTLGSAICSETIREFANLVAHAAILCVDWSSTDLFRQGEAVRMVVDNE